MDPRKAVDFSVCSAFACCEDVMATSKLLICRTRNRKSEILFISRKDEGYEKGGYYQPSYLLPFGKISLVIAG